MIIRVKDLWMRKAAFERVIGAKLDAKHAALFAPNADILRTALRCYLGDREKLWFDMNGNLGVRKQRDDGKVENPEGMSEEEFNTLRDYFNDWADEAAQEEINVKAPPISARQLSGAPISTADFLDLQELGLIRKGRG